MALPELTGALEALGDEDREALMALGTWRRFDPDEHLVEQDSAGGGVLVVTAGRVRVSAIPRGGRERLLAVRGPGEVIGDLAALDDSRRSATVTALDEVTALAIDGATFIEFLAARPTAMLSMLQAMARRLRESDRRLLAVGTQSVRTRLARGLLEQAVGHLTVTGDEVVVTVPLDANELASWIDATPTETLDALQSMHAAGLVESTGEGIVVTDIDGLRVAALL